MPPTFHSSRYWPSKIKYVPNWPTVESRLGDIGYLDSSGIWRQVLNILDDSQCRNYGIESLHLSHPKQQYIAQAEFNDSREGPFVKVSGGWHCRLLSKSELDSVDWDTMSAIANPELTQYPPQQGVEIQRSPRSEYLPLNGLILGPTVFIRKLHIQNEAVKLWLAINWNKIRAAAFHFQKIFQPHPERGEICLALSEYTTDTWTTVYDDGNTVHVEWLPIALGLSPGNKGTTSWDNLRLPRPTMRARLGSGDWKGQYVVGCDGIPIHRQLYKIWAFRVLMAILCCARSKGPKVIDPPPFLETVAY